MRICFRNDRKVCWRRQDFWVLRFFGVYLCFVSEPEKAHFFCIWKSANGVFLDELDQVKEIAAQVLSDNDLYLVDVELKGSTGNRVIWIYVESEGGNVSLDRCVEISREANLLLDASGWHGKKYTLNVSSPGLDRPLRDIRQYHSNIGRKARVTFLKDGEHERLEGKLTEVTTDSITLMTENKKELPIPFSDIVETHIVATF